jgi:hypothetical protein
MLLIPPSCFTKELRQAPLLLVRYTGKYAFHQASALAQAALAILPNRIELSPARSR